MTATAGLRALVPHPAAPVPDGVRVGASVKRAGTQDLLVRFVLEGPLGLVRIPQARSASFVNGLWRHTCFEVFAGVSGESAYHEWNLSPSGEWAAHTFRAYRDGGPVDDGRLAPATTVERRADRLELAATIPLGALAPRHLTDALRVGLAAVLETNDGALSWWALRHPPGKPDFHHEHSFAFRLESADS